MVTAPSTPRRGVTRYRRNDNGNAIQEPIEIIDLTGSPSDNDDFQSGPRQTPVIASLPHHLREFYKSIHNQRRPAFMQAFAAKLDSIKCEKAFVDKVLIEAHRDIIQMTLSLEEAKQHLRQAHHHSAKVTTHIRATTLKIVEEEKKVTNERKVIDYSRSWQGYLGDYVMYLGELYDLWNNIWDFVEDGLFCDAGSYGTGRVGGFGDDGHKEVTNTDEEEIEVNIHGRSGGKIVVAATNLNIKEAVKLHGLLMEIQLKIKLAYDGSCTHGNRAVALVQSMDNEA